MSDSRFAIARRARAALGLSRDDVPILTALKREADQRRDKQAELEQRQYDYALKHESPPTPPEAKLDPYGREIPERFVPRKPAPTHAAGLDIDLFTGRGNG